MIRNRAQRLLVLVISLFALIGAAAAAPKKANHHDGKKLLGEKVKTKGSHTLDKKKDYTVTADVKDGKVSAVKVKHAKKGDIAVKKYKTKKKLALLDGSPSPAVPADEYVGTTWIGFAYIDEDGYEEIYWFPYDMIWDPDTGAIEYVPAD